uniref:BHLH domain-containing protein n=1 Tax=Oryza glumipatula TaxID=40148 RepID=A0A0D9ZVY5_9ORYZ
MNRGEFQSSLVQQMIRSGSSTGTATGVGGGGAGSLMGSLKPCHEDQEASPNMPSLSSPSLIFSQQFQHSSPGLVPMNGAASLHDGGGGGHESSMPESWSQLLLGGLAGDQERYSATAALLSKGLENWGDHAAAAAASACMVGGMKEEGSMAQAAATAAAAAAAYSFYGSHLAGDHQHEIQAAAAGGGASNKSQLSQMLMASSPRSCITTSLGSNMLDFSNTAAPPELRSHHHNSDNSSECNSTATGSALKKARVQASSSAQSTLKVRKERLGDRITALHQIVSPFGKTDTASVLQETIGYIRFLLSQIEALSYPYMGDANGTGPMQNGPVGERNPGLFPEYPGQLLNHNGNTGAQQPAAQPEQQGANDDGKKDLRSRGLCLVPVSCTSHFGGDNAADYWAPAPLGGILRDTHKP